MRLRLYLLVVLSDALGIGLPLAVAKYLRDSSRPPLDTLALPVVLLPIYLVIAFNMRAYSVRLLQDRWGSIGRALNAFALSIVVLVFVSFYLGTTTSISRLALAGGAVVAVASIVASRLLLHTYSEQLLGGSVYQEVVICDGAVAPTGQQYTVHMNSGPLDPTDPQLHDRLAAVARGADRVIVYCAEDRRVAWATALQGMSVQSEIIAPELDGVTLVGLGAHDGRRTMVVTAGIRPMRDRVLKRAVDLAIAIPLTVALLPVFAVVALLIYLEDGDPVLFRQKRIGLGKRQFDVFKFRSMRQVGSDAGGARSASRGDDRITRIGRFLRSTSIDELPQLLNVVRGEMSLVGPRPHAVGSTAGDQFFWEVDGRYWNRHAVKPGITGLAQVRGFRGATEHRNDLLHRVEADLEYLENWSVWLDFWILMRTLKVVVHRNAF